MNKVIITGNVVRDAELAAIGDKGTNRCTFSIANSYKLGDKENVSFVPIVAWGNFAEAVAKYAVKGARLLIEGTLRIQKFDKSDKSKGTATEVVCHSFEAMNSKSNTPGDITDGEE